LTSCRVIAALCLCLSTPTAHAELIDRVLAVVDGQIVTLSDVRAALRFALVPADISDDPIQAGLRRLIERRLMLAEVERYAPPEPAASTVDARLAAVKARFKDPQAFEDALKQSPMSVDVLRRYLRDSLRIDTYLQQRFSSTAQPSEDEIVGYYKQHQSEFTVDGALRSVAAVREQVIARIGEERQAQAIREWLAGLWRRGSIVVLPSSPRS
jgi:hypothetical protein